MKVKLVKNWSVTQVLTLSFAFVILIGSILLSLPITHQVNSPETTYFDHLFNTVSMVCVTGLSVVPVADAYNRLGQIIAIILMQIGGLGLVTFVAISSFALKRKLDLTGHTLLQSALNRQSSTDLKDYLFMVYKVTFFIEGIAAIIISTTFIPRFGWEKGIFNSIFLAVSAFCNAGFDNLGTTSLKDYMLDPTINFVISFLIITGGIGFAVWHDIIEAIKYYIFEKPRLKHRLFKNLSNQTYLVLQTTGIILILGTLITWFIEKDNSKTIAQLPFHQQFMVSFFQTVTMRTAGFATLSYTDTLAPTNFLYMIQMIIGGGPGGTAGGMKVTTIAIVFLLFKSEVQGQTEVNYRFRRIATQTIKQTLSVIIFYLIVLGTAFLLLLSFESHIDPIALLFEAISAIATVGVTMDITSDLSAVGRIVVMFLMFIGRVGPITFLLSLIQRTEKSVKYPVTTILVG